MMVDANNVKEGEGCGGDGEKAVGFLVLGCPK